MIPPLTMSWRLSIIILPLNINRLRKAEYLFFIDKFQSYQVSGVRISELQTET